MMKVVLKLDYFDEKIKVKAMNKVSSLSGLDSISLDPKDKKMTLTGDIDAVAVASKLRKLCSADVISVGPAKESEKKTTTEPENKDGPSGDKAQAPAWLSLPMHCCGHVHHPVYYQPPPYWGGHSVEEDPNSCVIS